MYTLILLGLLFQSPNPERKTVWKGVYTDAQATRGQTEYIENCSACHGEDLDGVAHLKGADFMDRWREFNVRGLYDFISQSMPRERRGSPNKPGSLQESTYVSILAFIFRSNGFPAGADELRTDAMKTIQIEQVDGPKRVPNGALIQTVGCITRRGANWTLSDAAEPLRTMASQKSTDEELDNAKNRSLGQLRFTLTNLGYLGANFTPTAFEGHRTQAKGFIVWQAGAPRINVTSLEAIADTCR